VAWLDEYGNVVLARFGAGPFQDPLAELMKLWTVEHCQELFDALVSPTICCFFSGLNDEMQHAVRMFKPQTLHDAYCLAKLPEPTLASISRRGKTCARQTELIS